MPTSFQNMIARLFWPQLGPPKFTVTTQDVLRLGRTSYCQVNVTARLEGQVPADHCAWLVEFVSVTHFHPKRPLVLAFPWQRYVSESYLTSGNPQTTRRPAVVIVPKRTEPRFWDALQDGRASGVYQSIQWHQQDYLPAPGAEYTTA